jgi:hypothetical protein
MSAHQDRRPSPRSEGPGQDLRGGLWSRVRGRRAAGGALYVEILFALPVILLMFLTTWQLFDMLTAHLVVRHAADAAARAAAVIAPDEPPYYGGQPMDDLGGGKRLDDVRTAAITVLNAHPHLNGTEVNVTIDPFTRDSMVSVHVDATYHCKLAWVNCVCGFAPSRVLTSMGQFPYQAADVLWTE